MFIKNFFLKNQPHTIAILCNPLLTDRLSWGFNVSTWCDRKKKRKKGGIHSLVIYECMGASVDLDKPYYIQQQQQQKDSHPVSTRRRIHSVALSFAGLKCSNDTPLIKTCMAPACRNGPPPSTPVSVSVSVSLSL